MEVVIEGIDNFGRGVSKIDGKICFIPNALPEEVVDIEIIRSNKNFSLGKVIKFILKREDRIQIKCPFFSECGGCQFLNYPFDLENEYKKNKVKKLISKIGKIDYSKDIEIVSCNEYNYRNKVVFHVHNKKLGFYKEKSNELVEIDSCNLIRKEINEIIPKLKEIIKSDKNDITKIMIRCNNSNDLLVSLTGKVNELYNLEKIVKSVYINDKPLTNKFISNIGNYRFYISPASFFQINDLVVKKLYDEVLHITKEKNPQNVLDLYCGTGTIGIYVSSACSEVFGIDCAPSSIDDANKNKDLNEVKNIKFVCSKVEDYVDKIVGNYDLIIVDPPRAGLDSKTIDYLKKFQAETVIYISCDPVTLARDLNLLKDKYKVDSIKTFNMFPKTYHIETIAILFLEK